MKKFSIQVKIGLLLIFTVILLSATCYLSYRNLSSIVSSIQIDLNPELRLLGIREISRDLENADNSIRIYTITRDTTDLRSYYSTVRGIDEKVSSLRMECLNDSIMQNQLDTISNLIEENLVIWNELLFLADKDNVSRFLNQLSEQINREPEKKEKNGILRKVFARNTKNILDEKELISNIRELEKQDSITKKKQMEREFQLAVNSGRIKEKLYDLISRMERQVAGLVREKGQKANQLAESTYKWLVMISVSGGILIILVLFIIIRYISSAHAYQAALEKSKNETENLSRIKELFMANMSHEIRTPVTAISGFTEQLLHETPDKNILQSLKIIKSSSDHLGKIIDDILDLSKLKSGKLLLEQVHFSIGQITDDVYNIFEQQAAQRNIKFDRVVKPGTPLVLLGDPYRLKQILINLVGNAIKFTEKGSVNFSVEGIIINSENIDLVIEVADTGIGIEQDKLSLIFEDFTQAEMSTTRKYGGTGLGLSIVKNLVELHHGTIKCESIKNEGTKITCHLPFQPGLKSKIKTNTNTHLVIPGDIKKLKILVVDDEKYNRMLFKKILDRWGPGCDLAVSGIEALDILKERKYDILFMDIRMPGIDGLKATRFIREELKIAESEMKVICISAVSREEDRTKYTKAGMNAFLQKPFTEEMLLTAIISVRNNFSQYLPDIPQDEESGMPSDTNKINLNNLYHISGDDARFVKQMVISFISSTANGLDEIHKSAKSGEWELVADLAHKLRPPCRHIGALDLSDLIGSIETSSKNGDLAMVEKLSEKSMMEFEIVRGLLEKHISKIS